MRNFLLLLLGVVTMIAAANVSANAAKSDLKKCFKTVCKDVPNCQPGGPYGHICRGTKQECHKVTAECDA